MLPPMIGFFAVSILCHFANQVVVVVLPAEPVMPIVLQGTASMKICVSLESGIPRLTAASTIGRASGTPPEMHKTIGLIEQFEGMAPNQPIGWALRVKASNAGASSASDRLSLKVTCAPCRVNQRAKARPCRAAPKISTRLPFQSLIIYTSARPTPTMAANRPINQNL